MSQLVYPRAETIKKGDSSNCLPVSRQRGWERRVCGRCPSQAALLQFRAPWIFSLTSLPKRCHVSDGRNYPANTGSNYLQPGLLQVTRRWNNAGPARASSRWEAAAPSCIPRSRGQRGCRMLFLSLKGLWAAYKIKANPLPKETPAPILYSPVLLLLVSRFFILSFFCCTPGSATSPPKSPPQGFCRAPVH